MLLSLNDLCAQVEYLRPGQLVKLTLLNDWSEQSHIGTFIATKNDTLFYNEKTKIIGTYLGDIKKLYVSLGEKSNLAKGTIIGVFLGGLIGAMSFFRNSQDDNPIEAALDVVFQSMGIMIGAGVGALVGAIMGGLAKSQDWVEVDLPSIAAKPSDPIIDPIVGEPKHDREPL